MVSIRRFLLRLFCSIFGEKNHQACTMLNMYEFFGGYNSQCLLYFDEPRVDQAFSVFHNSIHRQSNVERKVI